MGGGICKVVETVGHGLNGYRFKPLFRQHLLSSPSPSPSPAVSRWSWSLCLVFQIWQKLRYLRAASVCMLELCAGIVCPYRYRDWCGQASSVETTSGSNFQVCCKVRCKMRKKTWEMMIRDAGSSYVCVYMFKVPPASLTIEWHVLRTATSASIQLSCLSLR